MLRADFTSHFCYSDLLQANVICIVYSVNNKKSIEKVGMMFKKNSICSSFLVVLVIKYGALQCQRPFCLTLGDKPLDSPHQRQNRQGQQVCADVHPVCTKLKGAWKCFAYSFT